MPDGGVGALGGIGRPSSRVCPTLVWTNCEIRQFYSSNSTTQRENRSRTRWIQKLPQLTVTVPPTRSSGAAEVPMKTE